MHAIYLAGYVLTAALLLDVEPLFGVALLALACGAAVANAWVHAGRGAAALVALLIYALADGGLVCGRRGAGDISILARRRFPLRAGPGAHLQGPVPQVIWPHRV